MVKFPGFNGTGGRMKKIYQTYCMCGRDTGLVGEQEGNERVEYTESSAAGECEDCARNGGDYAGTVATKKVVPFPSRQVAQDSLKKCKVLCACGEQMCTVGVEDGEDFSTIPVSVAIGLCLGCQGRGGDFGFAVVVQKAEQAETPDAVDQEEEVGRRRRTA